VVVPSAGLIGRGVATEYPSGSRLCPEPRAVEAIIKTAPSTPERIRLLALASLIIKRSFWAFGLKMRPVGRIFFEFICSALVRPFGLWKHPYR
jgi:hypothetical protein